MVDAGISARALRTQSGSVVAEETAPAWRASQPRGTIGAVVETNPRLDVLRMNVRQYTNGVVGGWSTSGVTLPSRGAIAELLTALQLQPSE